MLDDCPWTGTTWRDWTPMEICSDPTEHPLMFVGDLITYFILLGALLMLGFGILMVPVFLLLWVYVKVLG